MDGTVTQAAIRVRLRLGIAGAGPGPRFCLTLIQAVALLVVALQSNAAYGEPLLAPSQCKF